MRIRSDSVIAHPVDRVFEAYLEHLPEAAMQVAGVKEVKVESREEDGGVVRIHNVWVGEGGIPAFAQRIVSSGQVSWDDYAVWHRRERRCEWNIKPRAFREAVRCVGTTRFLAHESGGTRVIIAGDLDIDMTKVRGVPDVVGQTLAPQIEKFIVSRVTPNLERNNEAISSYLDGRVGR